MAGFADAGGAATASIANASTDSVTVAAAPRTSADLIAFEFCIVDPFQTDRYRHFARGTFQRPDHNGPATPSNIQKPLGSAAIPHGCEHRRRRMAPFATGRHLIRINARSAAGC
jgi:hypothetical protein